ATSGTSSRRVCRRRWRKRSCTSGSGRRRRSGRSTPKGSCSSEMFVPLTDIVTCPSCGPEWGLVLLADRVAERRVLEGRFGCPNARGSFGVAGGCAAMRPDPAAPAPAAAPLDPAGDREAALRLAALMGLGTGTPRALLVGPAAAYAHALAALL